MSYLSIFQAINDINYHQLFERISFIFILTLSHKLFQFMKTFSLFDLKKQFLRMLF